jgi:hypothetical protein
MTFVSPKPSNSGGTADVTVGTTLDGGAPVGTDVAFVRGAAWAGAAPPGGTGGDGQATAQQRVGRGQVGRECTVRNHSPLDGHDLCARSHTLAETGPDRCIEIWRLFLAT